MSERTVKKSRNVYIVNSRLSCILLLALVITCATGQVLGGEADRIEMAACRVIDGDTFQTCDDLRIRLWGIDAPEMDTRHGPAAKAALAALIDGRRLLCRSHGRDRYGRAVMDCMAGGQDVGAGMVAAGWAADFARYSHGAYAELDAQAALARRGRWREPP